MSNNIAAAFLKMPSLKIPKESCKEVAEAAKDVMDLYEIPLLNEKGMAWAHLVAVTAKVYIFDANTTETLKPVVISEAKPMPVFMREKV